MQKIEDLIQEVLSNEWHSSAAHTLAKALKIALEGLIIMQADMSSLTEQQHFKKQFCSVFDDVDADVIFNRATKTLSEINALLEGE